MPDEAAISLDVALRGAVRAHGSRACLFDGKRELSFDAYGQAVAEATGHLALGEGVGPGDRVAILDTNSIDFLVALGALARLGAVVVPLNYRDRAREHHYKLAHAGCSVLLHGEAYAGMAAELAGMQEVRPRCLATLGSPAPGSAVHVPAPSPGQPFAICYTSGTTGTPKGAVLSQHVFLTRAYKLMLELRLDAGDVCHFTTPMFHISCLILGAMAIVRGCPQLVLPQFALRPTLDAMARHRVSFANMVPTILDMIVNDPDYTPADFGRLRRIMYTAAPMPLPLLEYIMADYAGDLVQFLGQTEDLPQTALTPDDHRRALAGEDRLLASVGRASMGVDLRICDASGNEVRRGEVGEVVTRGGTAMQGYWNDREATAEVLRDGWVHSGDLAWQDDEGYVFLAGRKKHLIIRGGENVYPAEVEQVLAAAPGVREAVVVGAPDARWGEVVVAFIVAEDVDDAPDEAAILEHARAHLASYKCPARILWRETLPYNAAGKVERHRLQAAVAAAGDRRAGVNRP